jgi:hypothetical protein
MHLANAHENGGQVREGKSDTIWHVSTLVILHGSVFISLYYEYWLQMICIVFNLNIP